ncbi:MAG TPA: sulfite exporter TauE/SafE family protein [Bacteroidota bacterium]|nr:sulfite exporter TauE/SafE family protein [Bacteroidota bacterium]
MEIGSFIAIAVLIFFVAALYSSVGHGGASGYLAVLSLFAVPPAVMSSTALMLNILVAGVALFAYLRAGHLSFKLAWPFVVLSIPAAYLGGLIHVSEKTYYLLLASALVFAAYRLALSAARADIKETERSVKLAISLPVGASIGFLSGIVGIGGGIFLSPVMILFRWADAKKTSAVAALFIVVNSLAVGREAAEGRSFC